MNSPRFRIFYRDRRGVFNSGQETYPEWAAQSIADRLNKMPAYERDGVYHWIEPVKTAPVVRPSYRAHLRGEQ